MSTVQTMSMIQANNFIAEELLGWYEHSEDVNSPYEWYKEGEWKAKIGWNPCKNLKEAWDAADEIFEEVLVRKRGMLLEGDYRAWVSKNKSEASAHGKTPALAIVNAILKFNGKEELK